MTASKKATGASIFTPEADAYLAEVWPTYAGEEDIRPALMDMGIHCVWSTTVARASFLGLERPADWRAYRTKLAHSRSERAKRDEAALAALDARTAENVPLSRRVEPVARGRRFPVPPGGFRMGTGR